MICISLFIENGISRVQNIESALTQLGNGQIKDLKFMDDDLLLVLWDSCGTPQQFPNGLTYSLHHRDKKSSRLILQQHTGWPRKTPSEIFDSHAGWGFI